MREWNQLDDSIKSSPTVSVLKRELMRLVRPPKRSLLGFHDIEGVRLLTRLRVEFSDLREHRFGHNFQCSSPMCFCQTGIENNERFFHSSVDVGPENLSSTDLCNSLLDGNSCFSVDTNHHIIESTIFFIKSTSRFKQIWTNYQANCHHL